MKKIVLVVLLAMVVVIVAGCAMAKYDEGKQVVEYWRAGDQKTTGLDVGREDPDGVTFYAKLDTQVSEGKIQIEGVISALAELATALFDKGLATEAQQLAVITADLEKAVQ